MCGHGRSAFCPVVGPAGIFSRTSVARLRVHEIGRASGRQHLPTNYFEASRVANIKSQIKRIKTNEIARQRNRAVKSSLKTKVRRFRTAADAGDQAAAQTALADASRALDKAASKGVIHTNQAANRKSAMASKAASL